MGKLILSLLALVVVTASCTKEPAVLEGFNITASATDIIAGDAITFTIEGEMDFLTFFNGQPGNQWLEYPVDKGKVINLATAGEYTQTYQIHGTWTATFVASSYGNWSEDEQVETREFTITVTDNRTNVLDCDFIIGSLISSATYEGVIDEESNLVTGTVPSDEKVTNVKINFTLESPYAEITVGGEPFVNNEQKVDLTNPLVFTITSPDGSSEDWTLQLIKQD